MRGVQAYARQRVDSAPPEDVLLLLLEGAVDRIRQADEAMVARDRSLWNKHLHTVRAVFLELSAAIDTSMDPALAGNLRNTYGWIIHHSREAARDGDRDRLDKVRRVVQIVYDTWTQAVQIHREGGVSPIEGFEP
jgi:flagellar protein FliS